jgi:ferric-dicitrate binding protein FerR (iron transport regulator)
MAKSNNAKSALPYARRLLEDEYVQEQLRNAAGGLRAAYDRARKQRAQAPEDKRLYGHVREAATSIRNAATALQRPKPKPKRRLRKVAVLAGAVGACALLTMKLQKQQKPAAQAYPAAGPETTNVGGDASTHVPAPGQSPSAVPPLA